MNTHASTLFPFVEMTFFRIYSALLRGFCRAEPLRTLQNQRTDAKKGSIEPLEVCLWRYAWATSRTAHTVQPLALAAFLASTSAASRDMDLLRNSNGLGSPPCLPRTLSVTRMPLEAFGFSTVARLRGVLRSVRPSAARIVASFIVSPSHASPSNHALDARPESSCSAEMPSGTPYRCFGWSCAALLFGCPYAHLDPLPDIRDGAA